MKMNLSITIRQCLNTERSIFKGNKVEIYPGETLEKISTGVLVLLFGFEI